jgi:heterodisulfide reductase subunit C
VFSFLGGLYNVLIGSFEWLALAVLLSCVVFLVRRNVIKLKRFVMKELDGWPRSDANLILVTEILLMGAFLTMNAADLLLQERGAEHYTQAGSFPVSGMLAPLLAGFSDGGLVAIERVCWWFHIIGILAFLNYLPYSKHFHILLAFPNTWFSNLRPKTEVRNMERVMGEVKSMMDPSVPPPVPNPPRVLAGAELPERFGAKDVTDLTWKQLLDAYTCTECGRCTSECPANRTGKLLSPRKIMMDTRDRLEEVGRAIDAKGKWEDDGKALLGSYITEEELWACTTCNACAEACPVNIDPVGIIMDLRRYLVMEESKVPPSLASMITNVENNGAPWQMSQADRMKWAE